jgi:chemotaxis protein MotB
MSRPPRQRFKRHPQDPDNLDRWLVSYADFITLLFAFFVVMYAISSVNEGKYKMFGSSLTAAFSGFGSVSSDTATIPSQNDALFKSLVERRNAKLAEKLQKQQENMQRVAKNLNQVMAPLVTTGQVSVSQTSRGVVLEINASTLFNQGDAELQSASLKTLSEVANILGTATQAIEIEGYTDDVPIKTPRFPSNWELSSARASSVARLFIDHGIAAGRLTVVGSASNNPVAKNDTPEGRARNRRMTVTLLSSALERPPLPPVQ